MRIGLLSDTHIPSVRGVLPAEIGTAFRDVEWILHAGDIYIPSVLDELETIAPVLAAGGDDDSGDTLRDRRVRWKHVLRLEGQTLWLVHERPYPYRFASAIAANSPWQGEPDAPDIVVFGHEHRPLVEHCQNTLFINPGSPTFLNYHPGLGTVGILCTDSGAPQVQIVQL